MSKKKTVRVVPADPRPETIANVFAVSRILDGGFSGCKVETCRLSGTVEEKLAQYKAFFGKDWSGTAEQTYTTYEEETNEFIPLFGDYKITSMMHPAFIAAKAKIDALVVEAQEALEANEQMKKTWPARQKALEEAKRRGTTHKELVDVLGSRVNDENADF